MRRTRGDDGIDSHVDNLKCRVPSLGVKFRKRLLTSDASMIQIYRFRSSIDVYLVCPLR